MLTKILIIGKWTLKFFCDIILVKTSKHVFSVLLPVNRPNSDVIKIISTYINIRTLLYCATTYLQIPECGHTQALVILPWRVRWFKKETRWKLRNLGITLTLFAVFFRTIRGGLTFHTGPLSAFTSAVLVPEKHAASSAYIYYHHHYQCTENCVCVHLAEQLLDGLVRAYGWIAWQSACETIFKNIF